MALLMQRSRLELERGLVLAPERYDPRRSGLKGHASDQKTTPLGKLASAVRHTINPHKRTVEDCSYIVLDTSDVREGVVIGRKRPVPISDIGSAKKTVRVNDVLISRLRPYLRQVAFIDNEVTGTYREVEILCSTEFFVLRSNTSESISFLVPFLLSSPVQAVLAASQEGGHHPRFDEETLLKLPVPEQLIEARERSSKAVIQGANLYRGAEQTFAMLIADADKLMMNTVPRAD